MDKIRKLMEKYSISKPRLIVMVASFCVMMLAIFAYWVVLISPVGYIAHTAPNGWMKVILAVAGISWVVCFIALVPTLLKIYRSDD